MEFLEPDWSGGLEMDPNNDSANCEAQFLEESFLEAGFENYIQSEYELPYFVEVDYPESAPDTPREYLIGLAKRVLNAGGNRTGFSHHTEVRRSLHGWAPEYNEDVDGDPGYWGECAFGLTSHEINFGQLEGDSETKEQKARTVLAWGQDNIDGEVLVEIEENYVSDIRSMWDEAAALADGELQIRKFQNSPPDNVGGWHRFDASDERVKLAYRANNHGVPVVIGVYEAGDDLDVHEWTIENWEANNGDPLTTPKNRFPASTRTNDGPYARLRNHLRTYDADPLPVDTETDTNSSAPA